jgi:hypothetical protein
LKSNPELKKIALAKKKYRIQILYTQINRNQNNVPEFKTYSYNLDSNSYYYPASTVKLPVSIFALEKLNKLKLEKNTVMITDSNFTCQQKIDHDSTAINYLPSVEQYIKKMLLVSNNSAYSRVFEFVKPIDINFRLNELGYKRVRIVHRLDAACVGANNKHFNTITFLNEKKDTVYFQKSDSLQKDFTMPFKNMWLGKNIYNRKKKLLSEKKDFGKSNYLPLANLHKIMRNLVFWEFQSEKNKYNLSNDDWQFLMKHLGMYPRESESPKYDSTYFDSYKKYFIYGNAKKNITNDSLRILNIVGRAYGFQIDCAYIVNYFTGVEFLLSAVIYTNKNNSFGTGKYEYDIGLRYLKELSLALYDFESNRKKKFLPILNSVNFYSSKP